MFNKKKEDTKIDLLGKTNRIVEGSIIKGDITTVTDFRLDGQLIGNFKTTGKLVIGPKAIVLGDVVAANLDIEGRFEGRLKIQGLLTLKSSSIVKGEMLIGKLSVEPGADVTATCSMKEGEKEVIKTAVKSEK